MALSVETGQFAANTGGTGTTVSSGFQGKAIILFSTGQSSNGLDTSTNLSWSIGFSDGTNHRSIGWAADDNVDASNCGRAFRTDRALELFSDGAPTTLRYVSGVSFGASDFTITWDGTPAAGYLVGYILLGGSDITNVAIGTHTLDTATGPDSITGLGFQPDFAMFIHAQQTAAGTATRAGCGVGFAAGADKEFAMAWNLDDGQTMASTFDATSYTDANASLAAILDGGITVDLLANLTSFDVGGITFNISNAPPAAWLVGYLAIKGGQWDVGTTTMPSGAGTDRTISTMTFTPKGLALAATAATADATAAEANCRSQVGAATSTSTEVYAYGDHDNVSDPTSTAKASGNSKIITNTGSDLLACDFTSFQSNGWTITANAVTAGVQMGWFAMGDSAVTNIGKKPFAALLAHRRFHLVPGP